MENENAANLSDRSNALQNYITNNPGADITTWSGNTNRNRANENMWDDWYYFAGLTFHTKFTLNQKFVNTNR